MPDRSSPQPDQPGVIDRDLLDPEQRAAHKFPEKDSEPGSVMVELNDDHRQGLNGARKRFSWLFDQVLGQGRGPERALTELSEPYLRCQLSIDEVQALLKLDRFGSKASERAVRRIWMDHLMRRLIYRSSLTVKADASRFFFKASGEGIVWAVIDSGVDVNHPHFRYHQNLEGDVANWHRDFTYQSNCTNSYGCTGGALTDTAGHGTHVAGIIAGGIRRGLARGCKVHVRVAEHISGAAYIASDIETFDINLIRDREHEIEQMQDYEEIEQRDIDDHTEMQGIAPLCRIVSLKVLNEDGEGRTSDVMMALRYVREQVNGGGRHPRIHGVNLSLGYEFNAKAFACGQTPICVEVNRLVQSGVVVVVAAGNTGYGELAARTRPTDTGFLLTINDPGNAALAITVGSTHRHSPHLYGVSYFSSKGPTADGRLKPDLVAPGERIASCAAGRKLAELQHVYPDAANKSTSMEVAYYIDDSGTSMAAPHVSGAIAAFLSVRREFIGRPQDVKRIFLESATSLGREPAFQGRGLVDLMRALQAV